ncbi:MAG: kinase [Chitinophagaceae bacterium]|nr:kinase [Chitinophagaceae bacterium]
MSKTVTVKTAEGKTYQFVDNGSPMQGGMKDVYFSPDKSYVVAFFRDKQDFNSKERLKNIVIKYRKSIFENIGGEYWKDLFCWPYDIVEHNGQTGIIVPVYQKQFFFQQGYNLAAGNFASIKGKEKEGKWFASPQFRSKQFKLHLDKSELGDWGKYIAVCIKISRAVKRMHAAGLAHSDLSYKNVLIDPVTGKAAIIDIDGLVVPGKFPPDVIGTPDFIAPEVMATKYLPKTDPNRKLPNIQTDRHALAVMIYMYLLYRHPLRGGKIHDTDPQKDEELGMGSKALFVEHPTDKSNRPKLNQVKPTHLPWADVAKIPYTVAGPYLKTLFDKAFIDGLHNPAIRPTADEWEQALIKTVDLMQPCQNPNCEQKWFVFDNSTKPCCPFCGTQYRGQLPVLNLYYSPKPGNFRPENHRLMVYSGQNIYQWHSNRKVFPNERLTAEQTKPVADFHFHNGKWILINRKLTSMKDVMEDKEIPIGQSVDITDGKKILLSKEEGGRLVIVQLVNN